jgi:hypothetical protein
VNLRPTSVPRSFLLAAALALAPCVLLRSQTPAAADRTVRLQEFEVTEPRTSAQTMAPTESRLEATQPQSIINLQTIQNSIA